MPVALENPRRESISYRPSSEDSSSNSYRFSASYRFNGDKPNDPKRSLVLLIADAIPDETNRTLIDTDIDSGFGRFQDTVFPTTIALFDRDPVQNVRYDDIYYSRRGASTPMQHKYRKVPLDTIIDLDLTFAPNPSYPFKSDENYTKLLDRGDLIRQMLDGTTFDSVLEAEPLIQALKHDTLWIGDYDPDKVLTVALMSKQFEKIPTPQLKAYCRFAFPEMDGTITMRDLEIVFSRLDLKSSCAEDSNPFLRALSPLGLELTEVKGGSEVYINKWYWEADGTLMFGMYKKGLRNPDGSVTLSNAPDDRGICRDMRKLLHLMPPISDALQQKKHVDPEIERHVVFRNIRDGKLHKPEEAASAA